MSTLMWAAGLFEGEGSISVRRDGAYKRTLVQLKSTDLDVLQTFQRVMLVGNLSGPYGYSNNPGNWKPYWQWSVTIRKDFRFIMQMLGPHLHSRRLDQLQAVMQELEDTSLDNEIADWKRKVLKAITEDDRL